MLEKQVGKQCELFLVIRRYIENTGGTFRAQTKSVFV